MTTQVIGTTFPNEWLWADYERHCLQSITRQVQTQYSNQDNLIINLTWFGPQFGQHLGWQQYQTLVQQGQKFDCLFLISTVDPAMINSDQIKKIVKILGNPQLFKLGNFDGTYSFNFFAPVLQDHFCSYAEQDLYLQNPKYLYINYNRKPRQHRVQLVQMLRARALDHVGLITLGRPNRIYDCDPDNQLFLSLGEKSEDYVKYGHWFIEPQNDQFGIPHDVLSLHRLDYWQQHFLNIVGATEFNIWDDIFVSETQFKPIIGLRPFLINGNVRTYQWLRDRGFRTFNHWFPGCDLENSAQIHNEICRAIEQLAQLDQTQILTMYQEMLPDLRHNRLRFAEFAQEQRHKINNLL